MDQTEKNRKVDMETRQKMKEDPKKVNQAEFTAIEYREFVKVSRHMSYAEKITKPGNEKLLNALDPMFAKESPNDLKKTDDLIRDLKAQLVPLLNSLVKTTSK
jgi:hypothetical protein